MYWVRAGMLWLARTWPAGCLLREVFAHMAFVIPVERLRETTTLMAFHHPSPSYPVHILIVPKRPYRSLMDISPEDTAFQRDLIETIQSLVKAYQLEMRGYRLIANGGAYQDVPVLHYHLISEA